MKTSKHWGVVLDLGRRCIYGADLSRLAADARHAVREGAPLPRVALLDVGSTPICADRTAKFFASMPALRGFWLVENAARIEREQAEDKR